MIICIIPARSGSKRIKNKNIKKFNGKPIIAYTIETAKKVKIFKRIIVSTDSLKIAKIANKFGAETPFIREKKLSTDFVNDQKVLLDAIKRTNSEKVKYHCYFYPTSPLISAKDVSLAYKKIKKNKSDLLIAVSELNFSPYTAFKFIGKDQVDYLNKKYKTYRTQNLPRTCHDSGTFYIYKTDKILKKNAKKNKITFFSVNKYKSIDIDTEKDFKFAEFLHKTMKDKSFID